MSVDPSHHTSDHAARFRHLAPDTYIAHAGGYLDPVTGAVVPPLHTATTYGRDESYAPIGQAVGGPVYSRDQNPTYREAEAALAHLENGAAAMLTASGMAAVATIFQALQPGDHVVAGHSMYFGTGRWLREWCAPWGLEVTAVDIADAEAVAAACRPGRTKLVWIEVPTNPLIAVPDIAACADAAHGVGAKLAVDSTATSPALTRPLDHGADIVMHSATKYLNGHSDVVVGALVTRAVDAMWERMAFVRAIGGAVPGPFEAWLLLRGMRTLYVRMERHCANALAIARHFDGHPRVRQVCYPGVESFPGHTVAKRQMSGGYGGLLSLRLNPLPGMTEAETALRAACRTGVFIRATSLGGVESLIEHRATIEGSHSDVPADLLRLSVGIERADDLIADLEQALSG